MPNELPLQKERINEANRLREQSQVLIAKVEAENDVEESTLVVDREVWNELKKILGVEEAKQPEQPDTPEKGSLLPEGQQPEVEEEEETVDSLVENNTKEQLIELAEKRKVEINESDTKTVIAEKILEKKE